ncbi:uncharacterized protein G2W53_035384 [Senna tora]|uniref:Uncharacterized protein n=1 Tax=Senna tora TaxID=362788 RepID=A0A834W7I2_9FABA|nr:uncharacterized protein G2W53_035384 [Senna tora]
MGKTLTCDQNSSMRSIPHKTTIKYSMEGFGVVET